jgi:aspartyl-tRNA(Asn)/glutamyl-tRNA(Gln) amidotransferase subunit B
MKWEVVIGLETHAQLSTASKMFSGAATAFGAPPNSQACAVDIALPGVLPVLNERAVECAIRFGLAVNGGNAENLSRRSIFARKNYFYPDLPKGYQISQYEMPIVKGGAITILVDGHEKRIRLTRAHLEEDAGKSVHEGFHDFSGIDLNRAGTPLLEIVSEPDMRSAEEAVAYAKALHALVRWIGICDGNMQEGSFRCDANVSVRPAGSEKLGTRREIKNLNSFRFLQQAIEYETRWQIETLENGRKIEQATVLFDSDTGETRMMRTKEDAHDYRYFPDPDLLPLEVTPHWIREIQHALPELPQTRQERYQRDFGLTAYDSLLVTGSREMAEYFEQATRRLIQINPRNAPVESEMHRIYGRAIAKGVIGLLASQLNRAEIPITQSPVSADQFAMIHARMIEDAITSKSAREVFMDLWDRPRESDAVVDMIIDAKGLKQLGDRNELEAICDQVISANAKQVEDYRAGKDKAFNSLVGQVMKATKGKANPQQVNDILKRKLE